MDEGDNNNNNNNDNDNNNITMIIVTTWAELTDASGACNASQLCPDRLARSITCGLQCDQLHSGSTNVPSSV